MAVGTTQPQRFFRPVDAFGVMTLTDARVEATSGVKDVCRTVDTMAGNKQNDNAALLRTSSMLHEILTLCDDPDHQVVFTGTTQEVSKLTPEANK